jgi:hypothetical protein
MDDPVDHEAAIVRLPHEFEGAVDVAERTRGVRAAARDRVDLPALGPEALGHLLHLGVHVAAARPLFGRGAVEMVEEHVAVPVVVRVVRAGAVLQQDMAGHPEFRCESSGLAGVVRLGGALRHHHVRAHRLGLGHQEFELAGLVAARRQPRAIVALDPDLGAAEFPAQPVEPFERGRQMGDEETGEAGEMHDRS